MFERLLDYADRHGLEVVSRPALVGELHHSMECHTYRIEDGVIYVIRRAKVELPAAGREG